jgi:hypothetical protein
MPTVGDMLKAIGKLPMDAPKPIKWLGGKPEECEACHGTLGSIFYDCFVRQMGAWAIVCHACFRSHKCKLGTGAGQKYNSKTLEKVAG